LKVAIHQPNFFPWLGYFYKMTKVDVFVYHDNVEITKGGYTRRAKIGDPHLNVEKWLTVPLVKHSDYTLIKDLKLAEQIDWRGRQLRILEANYYRAPFFNQVMPVLERILMESKAYQSLAEFNVFIINALMRLFEIDVKVISSSFMSSDGKADEYNAALVAELGGDIYVSGQGGNQYQRQIVYNDLGIQLEVLDSSTILYDRLGKEYNRIHLSIVDAMMYLGVDEIRESLNG
jgi:hypothetical protein